MSRPLKIKELDLDINTGELVELPVPNFSYENIPEGCVMMVYENQQMIVHAVITVDGLLIAEGTVVCTE
jgi:hypothetical protein